MRHDDLEHSHASERKGKFASFNWMRGVADDTRISIVHRAILMRLCLHREKNGQCNPGYDTVADELGVDRSTVFRAVDVGIRFGWLAGFSQHGGRVSRDFMFTFPGQQQSHKSDGSTVAGERRSQAATVAGKRANSRTRAMQQSQENLQATDRASKSATNGIRRTGEEREREEARASHSRAPAPDDAALGREKRGTRERRKGENKTDQSFDRFWAVYPRKVNRDDARAAFAKVIADGADTDAVINGTTIYAAVRAAEITRGDPAKFTLYPATYLKKRKWTDPPPDGVVVDNQTGQVVGVEQPQPPARRNGYTGVADRLLREIEANGPEAYGWKPWAH